LFKKEKMNDLKTKEGRLEAIRQIEEGFLTALRKNGVELSDEAVCRVSLDTIELGISATGKDAEKGYMMAFASAIKLYPINYLEGHRIGRGENKMNFGVTSAFSPSDRECYWRTIHAASVLKNWEIVSEIVNKYVKMYHDLVKKIAEENAEAYRNQS
jgi:hypothetical protein